MEVTLNLPKGFAMRDDPDCTIIQDLMFRLNPALLVVQVATGVHVNGGCTINWGLVYIDGEPPTDADVVAALEEAGLDIQHNVDIHRPRPLVDGEPKTEAGGVKWREPHIPTRK